MIKVSEKETDVLMNTLLIETSVIQQKHHTEIEDEKEMEKIKEFSTKNCLENK